MQGDNFDGAKIGVLVRGQVLVMLRDDDPEIPFPGFWDLPGGARDGAETPLDCALREAFEETGLRINPTAVTWRRVYPRLPPAQSPTWFFAAEPGWLALPPVRLGDEGQELRWMAVPEFLDLKDAVPHLQDRLRDFMAEKDLRAWRAARPGA